MTEQEALFYLNVGNRLLASRTSAGLTQEELAERINLQSNSVHRYEAAKQGMSFLTAVKISNALNVSIDELIPEEYKYHSKMTEIERAAAIEYHLLSPGDQQNFLRYLLPKSKSE